MPTGSAPPPPQARQTLALDRPCTVCGDPIYHNYQGPVEGVCGKCADQTTRGRRRRRHQPSGPTVIRRGGIRPGVVFALMLLAFAAGAVAMHLAAPHLPY